MSRVKCKILLFLILAFGFAPISAANYNPFFIQNIRALHSIKCGITPLPPDDASDEEIQCSIQNYQAQIRALRRHARFDRYKAYRLLFISLVDYHFLIARARAREDAAQALEVVVKQLQSRRNGLNPKINPDDIPEFDVGEGDVSP